MRCTACGVVGMSRWLCLLLRCCLLGVELCLGLLLTSRGGELHGLVLLADLTRAVSALHERNGARHHGRGTRRRLPKRQTEETTDDGATPSVQRSAPLAPTLDGRFIPLESSVQIRSFV